MLFGHLPSQTIPILSSSMSPTILPHSLGHSTCASNQKSKLLSYFFCSLLINSSLGINSQWISTIDKKIADNISCLKKQSEINSSLAFDYTILKKTYLELRHCSFFQIQPEFILLIWDILLTKKWPNQEEVQTLKQRLLGKLITKMLFCNGTRIRRGGQ